MIQLSTKLHSESFSECNEIAFKFRINIIQLPYREPSEPIAEKVYPEDYIRPPPISTLRIEETKDELPPLHIISQAFFTANCYCFSLR